MSKKLRPKDMAEQMGVSLRTLRYWQAKGIIPFLKVNHIILFEPEKVQAALEQFEHKAGVTCPFELV